MLTVDRWGRLKELFFEAVERPEAERARFVDTLAAADRDLEGPLRAMLAAHTPDSGGLTSSLEAEREEVLAQPEMAAGRRIGPYEVVRLLGEGGMGAVYLARRTDPEFQQEVAIKLVRGALPTPEAVARFKLERQTLAGLVHPNIARLLDGGTTEGGLPYLVLEYVEGVPIDRWAEERALSIEQRIALLLEVAAGVAHAHAHLVVHRDLKPGNILVGADGAPKLLDFGIVKLLGEEPAEGERTVTRFLTPAWASPEQLVGRPVTTATDVHALGLLLYRLLAGVHPYVTARVNELETARAITEREPTKPSAATADPAVRRRLAGDLDTIVLRALAKEPERRYASAAALADDLKRHLSGQPVAAHPDSLGYRARKFLRRHRLAAAAAAAASVALAASAAIALREAAEARRERDRAQMEQGRTERMNSFLRSILASPDPVRGTGRELRVADLLADASRRLATELAGDPATEATLRATLGETWYNLGDLESAKTELDRARALASVSDGGDAVSAAIDLALARTLNDLGRWGEAEAKLRALLATRVTPRQSPALEGALRDVLAVALQNQGRQAEAIAIGREAVAALRAASEAAATPAARSEVEANLAAALNNLAIALGNAGELAEAVELHREAVDVARRVHGSRHPDVAEALASLAGALDIEGKYAEAEPIYREALALQEELLGERHFDFVRTLTSYANFLWLAGRPAEALPPARRAQALATAAHGDDYHLTAYAENILGGVLLDLGESAEAERHIRAALAKRRELLPPGHWLIASAQSNLGAALLGRRRFAEAERELNEAYAALLKDRGPEHEKTKLTAARLEALAIARSAR